MGSIPRARMVAGRVIKIEPIAYPSYVLSFLMNERPDPNSGDFWVTLQTDEGEAMIYEAKRGNVPGLGEYIRARNAFPARRG